MWLVVSKLKLLAKEVDTEGLDMRPPKRLRFAGSGPKVHVANDFPLAIGWSDGDVVVGRSKHSRSLAADGEHGDTNGDMRRGAKAQQ